MNIQRTLACAILFVASVGVARATTTYNSQATLEASAPALTFQGVNLTPWITLCVSGCSTITDSVTGTIFTASTSLSLSVPNATTIHVVQSGNTVTVTLPTGALAFGSYLTANGGSGVTAQFTGDSPNPNYSNFFAGSNYLGGRVVTGPISGPSYTLLGSSFDLGSFEVGTGSSSSTPEAGTLLSMGAGLFLIGAVRRRAR
jgi:hypothetical protein